MTTALEDRKYPVPIQFLLGWSGVMLAFAWGIAEGSLFFIVPDIIITLVAVFCIRKSLFHLAAVTAGSLVAGAGLYLWASFDGSAAEIIGKVPFVAPDMLAGVEAGLAEHGVWSLCHGPLSGIPYKVYAVTAPGYVSIIPFLLVSIPARLERLLVTWLLFAGGGWCFRKKIDRKPHFAVVGHALYWVAVYGWYWSVIG